MSDWQIAQGELGNFIQQMSEHLLADETVFTDFLLQQVNWTQGDAEVAATLAGDWINTLRDEVSHQGFEAFMREYDLSSDEGIVLMCLAEALLRIPDAEVAQALIHSKLQMADWESHLGQSDSLFVNASTWGLLFTGRYIVSQADTAKRYKNLLARASEPLVRSALKSAMRMMAGQYVMGETIEQALKRAGREKLICSFDMLGEAAMTAVDAERYFQAYLHAIEQAGQQRDPQQSTLSAHNISIKLSALHPRYEMRQYPRVLNELVARVILLCEQAARYGIALTIDAEEVDRLELSLEVFRRVRETDSLQGWSGLGLAVQAYQKRALFVLQWLHQWAGGGGWEIPVRLVKGAYWDAEIKRAQEQGLKDYPVFTRKENTDLSYMVCARFLLQHSDTFYPMFATHNAYTLAALQVMAPAGTRMELQRLHGMGQALHQLADAQMQISTRVYAPVGVHEDLLPYLVRRMLENGANTSFVNRIEDPDVPVSQLVQDPCVHIAGLAAPRRRHRRIAAPPQLYGDQRRNSQGYPVFPIKRFDWWYEFLRQPLAPVLIGSVVNGRTAELEATAESVDPSTGEVLARYSLITEAEVEQAVVNSVAGYGGWNRRPVAERAQIVNKIADLLEQEAHNMIRLIVREGGRTLDDAISELREAVDFCRYYATQAELQWQEIKLPGPTGESNTLQLSGRGIFVCISPWNFPLAIFTGQIVAALVAGNAVLAKPASQTPLIAYECVRLMHAAGVPEDVLHLLIGSGAELGRLLFYDHWIAGVAFTGSTDTAKSINQALAQRNGPLPCLIAETGGQNAMIVDSSALPEQVVRDAIVSAFNSAGQRCSALRVLYIQQDIYPRVLELLCGAMDELKMGRPTCGDTDVGPVIDAGAAKKLIQHVEKLHNRILKRVPQPDDLNRAGHWFAPTLIELDSIDVLEEEVFGPVLHVISYASNDLSEIIDDINQVGFGLTLGVHSRVDATIERIVQAARVGNIYVNRNMVGAVVGVQPFGGQGLSGTGPKAGGPHYLPRFATEKTVSINTAAVGGNTALLSEDD